MPFPILLLLALVQAQSAPSTPKPDALTLLNEVTQGYADAKSYHIEAVEELTTSNELQHSWQKSLLTAIVAPGGRYRYEGRSGYAGAIVVSDGTTQWIYHLNQHRYTAQPAPSRYPVKGRMIPHEENPALEATSLATDVAHLAHRLKSAASLPDETISLNGKRVECYVVHYSEEDYKTRRDDLKHEDTLWIDKARKVVVKTSTRMDTYMSIDSDTRIPIHRETRMTYPVVEFDQQEPSNLFSFVAPSDAKLVTEFRDPWSNASQVAADDLTGKPAPELRLKSPEGQITLLSSFRGKPVFIEFWATWCGPCIDLMPDLTKLYLETANKGLVWISVDDDEDADDAAKFMTREKIPWPNYHDEDGSLGKALERNGIPLGVLVDAEGKVAFHQAGYEIQDLRAAIAKLGPQFSSLASSRK